LIDIDTYWPILNSVGLIAVSSFAAFITARHWVTRTENTLREKRLVELEKQLALVSAAVVPISTAFQAILIKELTHFHTPELDALMRKIGPPSTLTEDEERRMAVLLEAREIDMADEISSSERDAARMLPMVIRRAKAEATSSEETVALVVSIPIASVTAEKT